MYVIYIYVIYIYIYGYQTGTLEPCSMACEAADRAKANVARTRPYR